MAISPSGTIAVERSVHDILNPGSGLPSAGAKAGLPNGVHKPFKPAPASAKGKSGKATGPNKSAGAAAVDPAQQMRDQQLTEESQVGLKPEYPNIEVQSCFEGSMCCIIQNKSCLGSSAHVWPCSI